MSAFLRTTLLLSLSLLGLGLVSCGDLASQPPPAAEVPPAAEAPAIAVEEAPPPLPLAVPAESPKATPVAVGAPPPAKAPTPVAEPEAEPKIAVAPTPPPTAEPIEAAETAPPEPAAPAFEFETLETRLRETDALGFFTKLELKNQIDDLLEEVGDQHAQSATDWSEQRERFDLLVLKVMTLLQDEDAELAAEISSARESLWAILADPVRFAELEST